MLQSTTDAWLESPSSACSFDIISPFDDEPKLCHAERACNANAARLEHHSERSPDTFTTFPHLTISLRMNCPVCSGVPDKGSAPCAFSFSRTSGSCTMRTTFVLSTVIMSRGVPTGASSPYQVPDSKPGRPDSEIVGRSGAIVLRVALVI